MIVSTSAECSSAIILILPIASAHGLEASYVVSQPIRQLCWQTSIAVSRHGFHIRTEKRRENRNPLRHSTVTGDRSRTSPSSLSTHPSFSPFCHQLQRTTLSTPPTHSNNH